MLKCKCGKQVLHCWSGWPPRVFSSQVQAETFSASFVVSPHPFGHLPQPRGSSLSPEAQPPQLASDLLCPDAIDSPLYPHPVNILFSMLGPPSSHMPLCSQRWLFSSNKTKQNKTEAKPIVWWCRGHRVWNCVNHTVPSRP